MAHLEPERRIPCSNCGMAPLPYELALNKIRSLAAGAALASAKRSFWERLVNESLSRKMIEKANIPILVFT